MKDFIGFHPSEKTERPKPSRAFRHKPKVGGRGEERRTERKEGVKTDQNCRNEKKEERTLGKEERKEERREGIA